MKPTSDNHIIFLSYGNPFYLPYVLSQCKAYHPHDQVHLIGDASNKGYLGIEHHLIAHYDHTAKEFAKHYIHLSSNNETFERFCFERWFIINEFLKKNRIKNVIILDTDVLVYANLFNDFDFFQDYSCTLTVESANFSASPAIFFLGNTEVLNDICDYMINVYVDKKNDFIRLNNHYLNLKMNGEEGGVCDMNAFYLCFSKKIHDVFNLKQVLPNSNYYNLSIIKKRDLNGNIEDEKEIIWEYSIPFGIELNQRVKYAVIHFQGWQKELIPRFTTRKGRFFLYNMIWIPVKNFIAAMLRGQWSLYFNFK